MTKESAPSGDSMSDVFRTYNSSLVRYLAFRVKSRHDAMEIAQEAFVRVLGMSDVGKVEDMESYLFRTAKNILIDRLRGKQTEMSVLSHAGHALAFGGAVEEACEIGPDDDLVAKDTVRALRAAIQNLPAKCRMAFVLYKFQDKSYREIAEQMDLTESMVRKYVLRGLRDIKSQLDLRNG